MAGQLERERLLFCFRSSSLVSQVLLVYDYSCTLNQELEFIWSKPLSVGSLLFFVNRYLPFLDTVGMSVILDFKSDMFTDATFSIDCLAYVCGHATFRSDSDSSNVCAVGPETCGRYIFCLSGHSIGSTSNIFSTLGDELPGFWITFRKPWLHFREVKEYDLYCVRYLGILRICHCCFYCNKSTQAHALYTISLGRSNL